MIEKSENDGENFDSRLIWEDVRKHLKGVLSEDAFTQWIVPVLPLSLTKTEIRLGVSDELFQAWLQDNFGEMIKTSVKNCLGREIAVVYESGHQLPAADVSFEPSPEKVKVRNKSCAARNKNISNHHTFKDFVVGPENEFAVAAAMGILKADGAAHANPLFIYGGTGLGKTHILQAVANEAIARNPEAVVEYISCEEFLNLYVDSLRANKHARFRNRFRKTDYLLIDDIHFISK
ncbi:MAG: ATP-binding protein, partial [Victivallales bacterium]|nr:ATP-binding protein [Victivallales bacterium]